jgi:RNA polymerase sigma factor (sigma-70 family)
VREVHAGRAFFSPVIAHRLHDNYEASPERGKLRQRKAARLSVREREVLQLVAEGLANKQIAAELGISVKTVEKHRQRLMQKLNIHDTAGLTRYAITAGIIESSVQMTIT